MGGSSKQRDEHPQHELIARMRRESVFTGPLGFMPPGHPESGLDAKTYFQRKAQRGEHGAFDDLRRVGQWRWRDKDSDLSA